MGCPWARAQALSLSLSLSVTRSDVCVSWVAVASFLSESTKAYATRLGELLQGARLVMSDQERKEVRVHMCARARACAWLGIGWWGYLSYLSSLNVAPRATASSGLCPLPHAHAHLHAPTFFCLPRPSLILSCSGAHSGIL